MINKIYLINFYVNIFAVLKMLNSMFVMLISPAKFVDQQRKITGYPRVYSLLFFYLHKINMFYPAY